MPPQLPPLLLAMYLSIVNSKLHYSVNVSDIVSTNLITDLLLLILVCGNQKRNLLVSDFARMNKWTLESRSAQSHEDIKLCSL